MFTKFASIKSSRNGMSHLWTCCFFNKGGDVPTYWRLWWPGTWENKPLEKTWEKVYESPAKTLMVYTAFYTESSLGTIWIVTNPRFLQTGSEDFDCWMLCWSKSSPDVHVWWYIFSRKWLKQFLRELRGDTDVNKKNQSYWSVWFLNGSERTHCISG